jgi:hypothetical protein
MTLFARVNNPGLPSLGRTATAEDMGKDFIRQNRIRRPGRRSSPGQNEDEQDLPSRKSPWVTRGRKMWLDGNNVDSTSC